MNQRHLIVAVLLGASSLAWAQQYEDDARVVRSEPEYERVNTPREECYSAYESALRPTPSRIVAMSFCEPRS